MEFMGYVEWKFSKRLKGELNYQFASRHIAYGINIKMVSSRQSISAFK
jgi:hypothetical protein